jgi:hypothetical protein
MGERDEKREMRAKLAEKKEQKNNNNNNSKKNIAKIVA